MTAHHSGSPACSRCGRPQPAAGSLRTSDGTPISVETYLDIAGLAGEALVCIDCLPFIDAEGLEPAGASPGLFRFSATGHTETLLDEHECRRLLPTQAIGRLAFTEQECPVIRPAHFVLHGPGTILAGLTDGPVATSGQPYLVAFEVDTYDPARQQGWWVCALGRCRLITDHTEIRHLDALGFTPWSNDPDRKYLAIDIEILRGRRLAPRA